VAVQSWREPSPGTNQTSWSQPIRCSIPVLARMRRDAKLDVPAATVICELGGLEFWLQRDLDLQMTIYPEAADVVSKQLPRAHVEAVRPLVSDAFYREAQLDRVATCCREARDRWSSSQEELQRHTDDHGGDPGQPHGPTQQVDDKPQGRAPPRRLRPCKAALDCNSAASSRGRVPAVPVRWPRLETGVL
jgi:hypothetical protein